VLLAVVNWEAMQHILDKVELQLRPAGFPSGYAFMFARDANHIIAHKFRDPAKLNNYGTRVLEDHHLPEVVQAAREGKLSARYEYPPGTKKISGFYPVDDADFGTVPVGLFESVPAIQQSVQLAPGEWLVAYSDGLSEALNDQEEEFGRDRLVESILRNAEASASEMRHAILASVRQHIGSSYHTDDLTLIVARVL